MPVTQATPSSASADPLLILKNFASLRKLTGAYPAGHPSITQKLTELHDAVCEHLRTARELRIDIIQGNVHLDGVLFSGDTHTHTPFLNDLSGRGIDSVYIQQGVQIEEILAVAECLWRNDDAGSESLANQLARRNVRSISLGRLVSLDTRWSARQWPDAPTGPLDTDYAESLVRAQETFEQVAAGKELNPVTVGDLVQLLIFRVARSHAALGQILAVKNYENLTYCHSVNVAMLSLLIGRQIGLDEPTMAALVEGALLHDIGKTRVPLEVVKKPGALDKRERRLIEAHTTFGAQILVQTDGLQSLTPTVALEHHRGIGGTGYPDLGTAVPHIMSQIVSVADIYEAMTGARSYQDPRPPEVVCLVLARLAGDKLNTAFVKAFVNAITFFPIGSLVRTNDGRTGVVVESNPGDLLHPVVALADESFEAPRARVDTSVRDDAGAYHCHIVETLTPPEHLDLRQFLAPAA